MKEQLKGLARLLAKRFGVGLVNDQVLQSLEQYEGDIAEVLKLPSADLIKLAGVVGKSQSQLGQDLFALTKAGFKRDGFFVEFGATNGVTLSNTHLLEKEFGWDGILAEPARVWHRDLPLNRKSKIETACVWRNSGSLLKFDEVNFGELSTISSFGVDDQHRGARKNGQSYEVKTISLVDLLQKYGAPRTIDYLSIDTEGSEFEILRSFDFERYEFEVITCEHNYTPLRAQIFDLLTSKGYLRKWTGLSKWDDWYVRR